MGSAVCPEQVCHSVSHSLALTQHPLHGAPPGRASLVAVWDSQLLLTYGAGYSILAKVVVQEHLK